VNWRLAPTIGLVALLAPAMAHAQTNLDQGKSASQIFAAACVECHKAPHGLAKGKNSAALTDFLVEHYTTSRAQAAALAAYVLGGRGAEPIGGAAQGKPQKPPTERADRGATTQEETKPSKHQARPPKPEEGPRSEAKSDAKPEGKPETEPLPGERSPTTATRSRHREPKTHQIPIEPAVVARPPAAVVAEPAPEVPPPPEASPAPTPTPETSTPGDAASGESAPVPRDNIPD